MSISSTSLKSGLLALILLAACSLSNSLLAQTDTGTPAAAPAAAAPAANPGGAAPAPPGAPGDTGTTPNAGTKETTALQFLANGGPVMYLLGLASVCVVWFTFEGFMILRPRKLAPPALTARLREALTAGNYQEAWNICKSNKCFLSAVLGAGLERVGRNKDAVEFAIEETAVRESTALKTNPTYLSVIGVVSPMIGLTGTVYGMIKAFHTLGENGITDPSKLASNIGEVLVATMSGLIVAIPAFVFFYILRARAQGAILYAESQVYSLLDNIPYEQLSGVRIGENFSTDTTGKTRSAARAGTSQKVSRNVTTNCPACNAPITVGTTPCPNCKTVLDWGT
jgi:biopolymer transport protein ExbB